MYFKDLSSFGSFNLLRKRPNDIFHGNGKFQSAKLCPYVYTLTSVLIVTLWPTCWVSLAKPSPPSILRSAENAIYSSKYRHENAATKHQQVVLGGKKSVQNRVHMRSRWGLAGRSVQVVFLLHLLQVCFLFLGVQLLEGLVCLVVQDHQIPAHKGWAQISSSQTPYLLHTLKPERWSQAFLASKMSS